MCSIGCVTEQHARRQPPVGAGALSIGLVLSFVLVCNGAVAAETPQQTCDRLAGDTVPLERVDAASAVPACAAAVQAAPGTPRLEYEYGRALEKSGHSDQAKVMYQWASDDGFAPATTALARTKAQPPSSTMSESEDRRQVASQLDALADIASRIAKTASRDHDDPIAVLALTGLDTAAILKWVQINTRLLAYSGTLRGSAGVLMDRAGNSLDRVLLLADLLRRAGNDVRIARAQLDPQTAAALRAQVQASTPKPQLPAPLGRPELLKALDDPRLDHNLVEKAVDQTISGNQRFEASVKDLYDQVHRAVTEAIGNDPKRDQRIAADAEVALRDHFWVQRKAATGWDDVDPDAEVVHKLTPATTFAPDRIPEDLKHRVTLRLILETWSAGKLSETKLLERSWTPFELLGKSITLSHALLPQLPIDQIAQQPDPQSKYVDGLAKAWVIEPMLKLGEETITDKLYTLGGQMLPAGNAALAQLGVLGTLANFGKVASGVSQAFGDTQNSTRYGPPDEATASTVVTAEWLEFQIDAPGRPAERQRRAIFDLVRPIDRAAGTSSPRPVIDKPSQERRGLALSGKVDVYVFGATPAEEWMTRAGGETLSAIAQKAAANERSAYQLTDMVAASPPPRLDLPLWGWALERTASGALGPSAPVAPNVALIWENAVVAAGRSPELEVVFDVVSNRSDVDLRFDQRVAQGVLDTVVEHAILGSRSDSTNTAAAHAADLRAGRSWVRLDQAAIGEVDNLALASEAKARIKSEISAGYIVIAPRKVTAARQGEMAVWWRVDPQTGLTLGVDVSGRGAEAAEEGALWNFVIGGSGCAFIAVTQKLVTGHGSRLRYVECLAAAALGAPHGINAIAAHGALAAVVATFEMWEYIEGD